MTGTRFSPPEAGWFRAFSGLLSGVVLVVSAACKENLSAPPTGSGPDSTGPVLRLTPANDTLVDSTGTLLITVEASDPSGIRKLDFFLVPANASYGTLTPFDTAFAASYSIPLAQYKHGTFRFFARGTDILDHETVSDTVTVTVR